MIEDSISLIIPTIARATLANTLRSLKFQPWKGGDEIILVGDGPQPIAREFASQFKLPLKYIETVKPLKFWGHGIRNWINENKIAKGRYLAALDDDDIWCPNTLVEIRKAINETPGYPLIFKMDWTAIGGKYLWTDKEIRRGNVGTPMLVCPNNDKLGRWGMGPYSGDFDFIYQTCSMYSKVIWREEIVGVIRPHGDPN